MAEPQLTPQWADYLRFRGRFIAMLDQRFYPAAWLDEQIASGEFVLLSEGDSAIIVSVKVYPSGLRELHGEAATGKRETIVSALIPSALQFGRSIGCEFATIASRPGWSRVMKAQGFEMHQVTIRKAL